MTPLSDVRRIVRAIRANIVHFESRGLNVQLGRSIIAVGQISALSLTSWDNLTAPVLGRSPEQYCAGMRSMSALCLGATDPAPSGRVVCLVVLAVVVAGVMPRVSAPLHAWVSISMNATLALPDGGEAVAAIFTLVLIPITFGDGRFWAWRRNSSQSAPVTAAIAYAASIIACLQLSGVYFESGLAKLAVEEWVDGSAMYYVVRDAYFGSTGLSGQIVRRFTEEPIGAALLTWGTPVVEVLIAVLILCKARLKPYALALVIALHVGIGLLLGLWSFSLIMIGASIVCCYRFDCPRRDHVVCSPAFESEVGKVAPL